MIKERETMESLALFFKAVKPLNGARRVILRRLLAAAAGAERSQRFKASRQDGDREGKMEMEWRWRTGAEGVGSVTNSYLSEECEY